MNGPPKRIGLVSVHTCPLAVLGGKETGGTNVYVREVARHLGRLGLEVDVFTRGPTPGVPRVVPLGPGPDWMPSQAQSFAWPSVARALIELDGELNPDLHGAATAALGVNWGVATRVVGSPASRPVSTTGSMAEPSELSDVDC